MWRDVKEWCGDNDREAEEELDSLVEEATNPLAGAVELTGRERIEALAVFATDEEKVELRKEWLACDN